jgi:hypothetical protein
MRARQLSRPTDRGGRGHSLIVDHGWQDVADVALTFAQRFVPAAAAR